LENDTGRGPRVYWLVFGFKDGYCIVLVRIPVGPTNNMSKDHLRWYGTKVSDSFWQSIVITK